MTLKWFVEKLKALRIAEVVMMSGFFMIGCFFGTTQFADCVPQVLMAFMGVILYTISVYTLNSYADYEFDKGNERLQKLGKIKHRQYGALTIVFFLAAAAMFYAIKPVLFIYVSVSFCLWCLYYFPQTRLKATFFGGTIVHFIAQILHFHLGYLAVDDISLRSILIASYFALLLSAGHLHHELVDYEADKANGVKTTAVRLGFNKVVRVIEALFLISVVYWIGLLWDGYITLAECLPFLIVSVVLIVLYMFKWNIRQMKPMGFRLYYRLMFLAAGIVFVMLKLGSIFS